MQYLWFLFSSILFYTCNLLSASAICTLAVCGFCHRHWQTDFGNLNWLPLNGKNLIIPSSFLYYYYNGAAGCVFGLVQIFYLFLTPRRSENFQTNVTNVALDLHDMLSCLIYLSKIISTSTINRNYKHTKKTKQQISVSHDRRLEELLQHWNSQNQKSNTNSFKNQIQIQLQVLLVKDPGGVDPPSLQNR